MLKGLIALVFLVVAGLAVTFVVGMRAKTPAVLNTVRRTNHRFMNPRQMESAGTPGAYASIVRHTGRKSGTSYETPVGVVASDDGFVISLPYGTQADWLKNVLAAGSATLVHEGETHDVDQPEVTAVGEAPVTFSAAGRRAHRIFGVDQVLVLQRTEPADTTPSSDENDRGDTEGPARS